jgi:hypothetical protein
MAQMTKRGKSCLFPMIDYTGTSNSIIQINLFTRGVLSAVLVEVAGNDLILISKDFLASLQFGI